MMLLFMIFYKHLEFLSLLLYWVQAIILILCFCFDGDCLSLKGYYILNTGLVSFLLGHIAFIFAFHYDGGNSWRLPVAFCLYAYAAGMVYIIFTFGKP